MTATFDIFEEVPQMTELDWRHFAACNDEDPELFFAVGKGPAAKAQDQRAKAVCAGCPVRADCLDFALAMGLDDGVFGGLDRDERRALKRRRVA